MLPPFQLEQAISSLVKEEWGRISGALLATTGNLQVAEDALQDAIEIALVKWQKDGLPDVPAAWLLTTARNKAVDHLRRQSTMLRVQPALAYELELDATDLKDSSTQFEDVVIPDKRLELIFICCHPALERKTRVALTLRTLGGLSTDEIAKIFLDKPATLAQRLVRARHKIANAGIVFELPDKACLDERLDGVLSVIYFIFSEGYAATGESLATRRRLEDEAIRLGRIMRVLMPENAEVAGLLALMLLHDSRRTARESKPGVFVSLEQQDRTRWDHQKIAEGLALLNVAMSMHSSGAYQIQAAISALHAQAVDWQSTDWKQIVALYAGLYELNPSPVIKINHAVALSYAQTPAAALRLLATVQQNTTIDRYQPYHVAQADLLSRTGQQGRAIQHLQKAIALCDREVERINLCKRLARMQAGS